MLYSICLLTTLKESLVIVPILWLEITILLIYYYLFFVYLFNLFYGWKKLFYHKPFRKVSLALGHIANDITRILTQVYLPPNLSLNQTLDCLHASSRAGPKAPLYALLALPHPPSLHPSPSFFNLLGHSPPPSCSLEDPSYPLPTTLCLNSHFLDCQIRAKLHLI